MYFRFIVSCCVRFSAVCCALSSTCQLIFEISPRCSLLCHSVCACRLPLHIPYFCCLISISIISTPERVRYPTRNTIRCNCHCNRLTHVMLKKLSCSYTNQKTKKRKRWEDGFIAVHSSGLCALHPNNATALAPLDSRFISPAQAQQIAEGRLREVEFDGYLVEISEEACPPSSLQRSVLPQAIPKFKIPASRPRPNVSVSVNREGTESQLMQNPIPSEINSNRCVKGRYHVSEDELDSIWGPTTSSDRTTTTMTSAIGKIDEGNPRVLPHQKKGILRDVQQKFSNSWGSNPTPCAAKNFVQLEDGSDEDMPAVFSQQPHHSPIQRAYGVVSSDGDCDDFWGKPTF